MAVLTVDSNLDVTDAGDGVTTLREAIAAANDLSLAEDARIVFDSSIDGETIFLSDGELFVQRSMVIDGLSVAHGITLDVSHSDADPAVQQGDGARLFRIDDGSATFLSDVQMQGITLRGGDTSGNGGAILTAERLTLIQSTLVDNHSQGTGGAIFADCGADCDALVILNHVEITGNKAHEAGGVYVAGALSALEVNVHANTSTIGAGGLQVSRATANVKVRDSIIANNHGGSTGGLFVSAGTGVAMLDVATSKFTENVGNSAGGIMALGASADISIDASQFISNSTIGGGGALFVNISGGTADVSINQSTFASNDGGSGGAVFVRGLTSISDVTVVGSTFSDNESLRGGGSIALNSASGRLRVRNATIVDGHGSQGGGIWLATEELEMSNSILAGNTAATGPDLWKGAHAVSVHYSLIGNRKDTGLTAAPVGAPSADGNLIGSAAVPISALLAPLADNGGPTLTRLPQAGSPAIDAGDIDTTGLPRSDQRRFPFVRVANGHVDMGAVEAQATPTTSALTPASSASLKISEVNYHPADPSAAEVDAGFALADEFEFIELTNISQTTIDLTQVAFVKVPVAVVGVVEDQGVDFNFADSAITQLAPGETVLVVENQAAMEARYGGPLPIAGEWNGQLSDSSELITVVSLGPQYTNIAQFRYQDTWFPETDGVGKSLEVAALAATDLSTRDVWQSSAADGGSPGTVGLGALVYGDVNFDGLFASDDLISVFQSGKYVINTSDPSAPHATWAEGDWDMDGFFTSHDLVVAFQRSTYQNT